MYSPLVVAKTLHRYKKSGLSVTPHPADYCLEVSKRLDEKSKKLDSNGRPAADFTPDERAFMRSETLLCRADFRYWAERYGNWERDASEGGGVGPAKFWPSQERALDLIAKREEEVQANYEKHGFSSGILIAWHKTRQQGATGVARLLVGHRLTFYKNTRSIASSVDDKKLGELYTRDKVWYDNLPFFLRPEMKFDVVNNHFEFNTKSRITYQAAGQEAGIGTGQQFDISHMTEVALWPYAERLQFDFWPAVPKAPTTLVGFESTACGKNGFWYEFTESIRKRLVGFEEWIYSFTPWYINWNLNRLIAPDSWVPDENTQRHADLIERTSIAYAGKTIRPDRFQLYWWEMQYKQAIKLGTLHIFLSNYPATPEQSFQYATSSALPHDIIEHYRACADYKKGMPYEVSFAQ